MGEEIVSSEYLGQPQKAQSIKPDAAMSHVAVPENLVELCLGNASEKITIKRRMKKRYMGTGFLLGVAVTALGFIAYHFCQEYFSKEALILRGINEYYLGEIDETAIEEGSYKGMVAALEDPYSEYFTKEENTLRIQDYEGSYRGIGVVLQQEQATGTITVVNCYSGSPAEAAGIQSGDILYQINGESVADKELTEAVSVIKTAGDEGVDLTLIREGHSEYIEVNVVPNEIIYPVVEHKMLEDQMGYLAISQFKETTYEQFHASLENLKEQNMKGLIVDLRNNTGGLLNSVNAILNDILPAGTIVYTVDKNGQRKDYVGEGKSPLEVPVVVLVNEYTASASEIFAGAVRDYDMGKLVGTQTYGKGVVQSTYYLDDGSGLKLTIANYYTPKGVNIHGTGLTPDVEVELDTTVQEDGTYVDNQLEKSCEILRELM